MAAVRTSIAVPRTHNPFVVQKPKFVEQVMVDGNFNGVNT